MLEPGERVGDYRVERHLASGAMGDVYRVRHATRGTAHALKCLGAGNPRLQRRLEREARLQEPLGHPNVVRLTDVLDVRGAPALVMELVEGPTLADHLHGRVLGPDEAIGLFRGVVEGLAHAHAHGVVHRDLKPSNVLLARTPEGLVPKVADFGLAKALDPEDPQEALTASGASVGSPWYMSPEQIRDPRGVGPSADVFSAGCLLYEMLTGRRAFPGTDPVAVLNAVCSGRYAALPIEVPAVPARVVQRCLQVDPADRYADAAALLSALSGRDRLPWLFAGPPTVARVLASSAILAISLGGGVLLAWVILG